ncbi:diguanylate cyclase [Pseudomonas sp. LPB0260]|uniref:diguanylate cyclase n=1 Tax=Pseudomonas sp. LPB0260 TaxID=2614442 RepID=UPI0015C1DEC8|nr:diguanylate cyclase [Pseudomonas sp. LPB0260]QLC73681.1 diguanylate cyclase [Pseudomonas sp. LPB0260]QLC76455.1 diguanylate cyclase [Pseudomonas sp. LPB0260]
MTVDKATGVPARTSLRTQIIVRGALRSLVIAALLCLASYYHVAGMLEDGVVEQLEQFIAERGRRDSEPFLQTERHHRAVEQALLEQLQSVPLATGAALFDDYFEPWPDGTWRTRTGWYEGQLFKDGLQHRGFTGFIGRDVELTPQLRHRAALIAALLDWYGSAWTSTGQYINYFVSAPENLLVGEFIGVPYLHQVPADTYFPDEIFVARANEAQNPERQAVWTHFYFDATAKMWMLSSLKPVYLQDRLVATLGQDILLDDFMQRTLKDALDGTENIAFSADGSLIAYEPLLAQIQAAGGTLKIDGDQPQLQGIFAAVTGQQRRSGVTETDEAFLAYTRIDGPDWYLVNIYPKQLLQNKAMAAATIILGIALLGLLSEFAVLWLLIEQYVLAPLRRFIRVTEKVGEEGLSALQGSELPRRRDEFGRLASRFRETASELEASRQALLAANRDLDAQVAARTEALTQANQRLATLAITDELSGLHNRRQFQLVVPQELARLARLQSTPLWATLAVLDIDHFKQINDRYGHAVGDQAIRQLGACLSALHRRAGDHCFRLGGEEFALFASAEQVDGGKLQAFAAHLLEAVRSLAIEVSQPEQTGRLTVSVGIACVQAGAALSLESLYKLADDALYLAKQSGRDQARIVLLSGSGEQATTLELSVH